MYTFATFDALQTGIPTTQLTLAAAPHSALAFVSLGLVALVAVGIGLFAGRGERSGKMIPGRVAGAATANC
jgi:hypothetical protein